MPALGSNINAALGRIDYSPIARGGEAMAKGVAEAGRANAQGLMAIGGGLGAGIQAYKQNKAINNNNIANIEGIMISDPGLIQKVGSSNEKLGKMLEKLNNEGTLKLKESSELDSALNAAIKAREQQQQQAQVDQAQANAEKNQQFKALEIGQRQQEINARASAGPNDTSVQQNARATVVAELEAGTIQKEQATARFAELMATGGSDRTTGRNEGAGTFVLRDGGGGAVSAVRHHDGRIGTFDGNGKFSTIDQSKYVPMTTGDSNVWQSPEAMTKLSDKIIQHENTVRLMNKLGSDMDGAPTGMAKITAKLGKAWKAVATGEELTEEELLQGMNEARQQALLGKLRTEILGPGVLTEIDAQRIVQRLGGDIGSIFTHPELVYEALQEVLVEKTNAYEQDLNIYNSNVAGLHGNAGYNQRKQVMPFGSNTEPAPQEVDPNVWAGMSPDEKAHYNSL